MPLHYFFFWLSTDTHIRFLAVHPILQWIVLTGLAHTETLDRTSSKPRSKLKDDTLKKWESTLNLCVHAHGYDVELLMKTPRNDNYPLVINSSCTYDWVPCDHGSDELIIVDGEGDARVHPQA